MMKHAASRLETPRLRLLRLGLEHAGLVLELWNDPAFIRFVGDRGVRTIEQARDALQDKALKLWLEHGYGPYLVQLADGTPIGVCGLFKRENLDHPDIGYGVLPAFRGRGYALEAALAMRDHAREEMELPRITAIVSPDNGASVRLLEKLGMSLEGPVRMPGEEQDILLYGMDL